MMLGTTNIKKNPHTTLKPNTKLVLLATFTDSKPRRFMTQYK